MSGDPSKSGSSRSSRRSVDRVLAVDDSPDNLFLIESILEEDGYEVHLVEDGAAALDEIQKDPPDLLLLDVMMPGMDGYEVTRHVRENKGLPYIPILLITAHDQPCVVDGLDAGADDFIRKPIIEVDELLARVRSLLRLKHTMDERDQIARQRADFVSRLTHDLRTPLVAADRTLALFQQGAFGNITSDMGSILATMTQSNRNLLQMVNTLLEVYRYEAGVKSLTFAPFDILHLVQEVLDELAVLAREQNLHLRSNLDSVKHAEQLTRFVGDRIELRRVLSNLIGNALKFTDRGYVDVRLSVVRPERHEQITAASGLHLMIEIEDTGSGIAESDQSLIFQRFRHGNQRRSGSGLGLYLSRCIVEGHRGKITVRSEIGEGSTFKIDLPLVTTATRGLADSLNLPSENPSVSSASSQDSFNPLRIH